MEREIQRLLCNAGVSCTYVGYNYLVESILLAYEDHSRLLNIFKEIYVPVAERYNTNPQSVVKAICTVRDVFMKNNGKNVLKEMGYKIGYEQLYPRELIEMFVSYLRNCAENC